MLSHNHRLGNSVQSHPHLYTVHISRWRPLLRCPRWRKLQFIANYQLSRQPLSCLLLCFIYKELLSTVKNSERKCNIMTAFWARAIVALLTKCSGRNKTGTEGGEDKAANRKWDVERARRFNAPTKMEHATFICSLCIANPADVTRPSSFMQIV